MEAAKVHIDFRLKLSEIHRKMVNIFLYEHPRTAISWKLKEMQEFIKKTGVIEVSANMCRFGMKTHYRGEEGKVSKPTRCLTSSPECAKRLGKDCNEECKNKNIAIWGDRARVAQRYPPGLCKAVVEDVRAEKMRAESDLCEVDVNMIIDLAASEDIEDAQARHEGGCVDWAQAWDDVTGKALEPKEVVMARKQEMQ